MITIEQIIKTETEDLIKLQSQIAEIIVERIEDKNLNSTAIFDYLNR